MMRFPTLKAARFCKDESGVATIDFVIVMTFFIGILAASVELGTVNLRHAMLERGLDTTVRDVRLSTGAVPDYPELRRLVCARTSIIVNCEQNLQLEMKVVNPRDFQPIPADADCRSAEEEPAPVRQFDNGVDNDLMLMRACLKFKPFFPTTGLGKAMTKDANGYIAIAATSAFVQEPR